MYHLVCRWVWAQLQDLRVRAAHVAVVNEIVRYFKPTPAVRDQRLDAVGCIVQCIFSRRYLVPAMETCLGFVMEVNGEIAKAHPILFSVLAGSPVAVDVLSAVAFKNISSFTPVAMFRLPPNSYFNPKGVNAHW